MADENAAGSTANANAQGTPPSFNLIGQYIRDMSFENPGAPGSIMLGGPNPSFNVGINVGVVHGGGPQIGVEFVAQRHPGRDVEAGDFLVGDAVEVFHQGPQ